MVTSAGLADPEKRFGCPLRNDIHGIDVYKHVGKLMFCDFKAKETVGKSPPNLMDTFQREYLNSRHLTEKQFASIDEQSKAKAVLTELFTEVKNGSRGRIQTYDQAVIGRTVNDTIT